MEELYGKFFEAVHQFRKLNVVAIMPDINQSEFEAMNVLMNKEDGKVTISELAYKSKVHSSAISRTLHGLEKKATWSGVLIRMTGEISAWNLPKKANV